MELNKPAVIFLSEKISAYVNFTQEQLKEIIECFECRVYYKNQYLLKEGQICDFWGYLQHGLIRSYSFNADGEEYTIGCIYEGHFTSESSSFVRQVPTSVNIQALEDTTLITVSYEKLQQLFQRVPEFERFARKLYEDRMANIKAGMLYRVQLNATDRYLHFLKIHPKLARRVPLKYIASYLNITDSTLSRIRRKISRMKA